MGRLIYSMLVSLDGYIEGPNHALDWAIVDEQFHKYVNDRERDLGAFVYGRRTYEVMAAFWPTADANPAHPDYIVDFARIWKSKPKFVFSRTLEKVEWNSKLVRGNVAEEVAKLKQQYRGDLAVGGANLAATLMRLGLIDEYQLYVNPVILGGGTPMFPALSDRIGLRLVETRAFGTGVVFLRYLPDGTAPG